MGPCNCKYLSCKKKNVLQIPIFEERWDEEHPPRENETSLWISEDMNNGWRSETRKTSRPNIQRHKYIICNNLATASVSLHVQRNYLTRREFPYSFFGPGCQARGCFWAIEDPEDLWTNCSFRQPDGKWRRLQKCLSVVPAVNVFFTIFLLFPTFFSPSRLRPQMSQPSRKAAHARRKQFSMKWNSSNIGHRDGDKTDFSSPVAWVAFAIRR